MLYEDAFRLIVSKQREIINNLRDDLEVAKSEVAHCPNCGASELLCGYPRECCIKGEEK